jgi:hypothetical protein
MSVLSQASQSAVVNTCERMCCWPSEAFGLNKKPQKTHKKTVTLSR